MLASLIAPGGERPMRKEADQGECCEGNKRHCCEGKGIAESRGGLPDDETGPRLTAVRCAHECAELSRPECGIADVHARAVQAITGTGPAGIYDTDPARSSSFGHRYSCRIFESPDDLCRDPDIDIVCICTPSGHHLEPALRAISEGKHCIIEKPLEITLERCDMIIEAGIKNNVIISGIFPMRFSDVNKELRKAIDADRFGKFVLGDVYVKWFRNQAYYNEVKWRGSISDGGGGAARRARHPDPRADLPARARRLGRAAGRGRGTPPPSHRRPAAPRPRRARA